MQFLSAFLVFMVAALTVAAPAPDANNRLNERGLATTTQTLYRTTTITHLHTGTASPFKVHTKVTTETKTRDVTKTYTTDTPGPTVTSCNLSSGGNQYKRDFRWNEIYSGTGYRTDPATDSGDYSYYSSVGNMSKLIDGSVDTCDAVVQCLNFADSVNFFSFDLHWQISQGEWLCTIYGELTQPSDFNVQDADVGSSYGYNFD